MNSREAPTNSQVAVPNGAPTWDNDGTFIAPATTHAKKLSGLEWARRREYAVISPT
jgi:hypothetical protein